MNIQEKITELTGLSKLIQDEVLIEVKANQKRLNECAGPHDFSICIDRLTKQPIRGEPTPAQLFGTKWECSKCHGRIDSINKNWYQKGLHHASVLGSKDDV